MQVMRRGGLVEARPKGHRGFSIQVDEGVGGFELGFEPYFEWSIPPTPPHSTHPCFSDKQAGVSFNLASFGESSIEIDLLLL